MEQRVDQASGRPAEAVPAAALPIGRSLVGLAVLLTVFIVLCPAKIWRPDTLLGIDENAQIAEAKAWARGELTLPERKWDTALFEGRIYNHFPPMFTFLSLPLVLLFGGVPHWSVVLLVALPPLVLSYLLFLRLTRSPDQALLLSIGLMCGTSVLPVLEYVLRGAAAYDVNHMLAVSGQLLVAWGLIGRPRIALAGAGALLALWARQLTLAYFLPVLAVAWFAEPVSDRPKRLALAMGFAALGVGALMTLNALKFGDPLDTGYRYLYVDRPEDSFSRDAAAHGLFSPHFIPRNAYYLNVGLPRLHEIEIAGIKEYHLRPNVWGTGIWWTTPLFLLVFVDFRRIWSDPVRRAMLLGAGAIFLALLCCYATGYRQRGYNRFSLDFVPILFVLIAPTAMQGWRKWFSGAAILWSVVYFGFLI